MASILIALAAAATFGAGIVTTSSLDYIAQIQQLEQRSNPVPVAPATSFSLTDFGIDKIVCIHTPGHIDRQTCEGTATKIPPLVRGANAIQLPIPVRAYVVQEAGRTRGVDLDFYPYYAPDVAEKAHAAGMELQRQLKLATRCVLDTGDTELWRAGPAFVATIGMPLDRLLFVTADTEIELGVQSLDAIGRLFMPPETLAFNPIVTAGDCAL